MVCLKYAFYNECEDYFMMNLEDIKTYNLFLKHLKFKMINALKKILNKIHLFLKISICYFIFINWKFYFSYILYSILSILRNCVTRKVRS